MNKSKEIEIFCDNIKYLRKKHNLSRIKMAKSLGITVKSLNMLESGVLPPRLTCRVLLIIFENFSVLPKDMLEPLEKQ